MKCPCCGCEDEFIQRISKVTEESSKKCPCCGSIMCWNGSKLIGYIRESDIEEVDHLVMNSNTIHYSDTKYFIKL